MLTIKVNTQTSDKRSPTGYKQKEQEVHKVQILDPATGTGTFLAEVVKHIHKKFQGQQGIWNNYVETHLLPRLNGFELLMASYAMAHLKLDLLLKETTSPTDTTPSDYVGHPAVKGSTTPSDYVGHSAVKGSTTPSDYVGHPSSRGGEYYRDGNQRLRVYLTNSLEESHPDTGTLFANWLSTEANEANHIKRDTPVMCVIGNPPYSGISSNNGKWISDLIEDYKYVDGVHFNERKHWLNDDYVKFLRYGQHYIEKNGSGVLAFINPHGFLDNPTFRGMRWHLLKTYDKIYTIDLHGNSKKKETAPDGSADINVFDIQQGVSINIFIKKNSPPFKGGEPDAVGRGGTSFQAGVADGVGRGGNSPTSRGGNSPTGRDGLAQVFHYDLYGKREFKYDFLNKNSIGSIDFKALPNVAPMYFMVQKDFEAKKTYDKGFSVNDLFLIKGVGLTTAHDDFVIKESKTELLDFFKEFQSSPRDTDFLHKQFNVRKKKGWDILQGYDNIRNETHLSKYIEPISYRPFDNRFVFYEDKLVWRTVRKVMQHFLKGENPGLVFRRQQPESKELYVFCSNKLIADGFIRSDNKGGESVAPLYLYPDTSPGEQLEPLSQPAADSVVEGF